MAQGMALVLLGSGFLGGGFQWRSGAAAFRKAAYSFEAGVRAGGACRWWARGGFARFGMRSSWLALHAAGRLTCGSSPATKAGQGLPRSR